MSIVITQVQEDRIVIGADSALTMTNDLQTTHPETKLLHVKNVVAGFSGNAEHFSVFRYYLETIDTEELIAETTSEVLDLYATYAQLAKAFDLSLRGMSEEGLTGPVDGFHLLLNNKAWVINGFYVSQITNYAVLGCGAPFAYGALYAGGTIEQALHAACEYDIHCKGPLNIYEVFFDGRVTLKTID